MTALITVRKLTLAASLCAATLLAACHSYHIDAAIENRTGADIQLLEVDYPSASFGAAKWREPSCGTFACNPGRNCGIASCSGLPKSTPPPWFIAGRSSTL